MNNESSINATGGIMNIARLRGLMVEKGFTQQQMADRLGISLSTFNRKLMNGGNKFTLEEIVNIKEALALSNQEASVIFFRD